MNNWQVDLVDIVVSTHDGDALFKKIAAAARSLGFEYCGYGLRPPLPVTDPKILMLDTYPPGWRERYAREAYLRIDPIVSHGCRSEFPLIWNDNLFTTARSLWDDAQAFGLRYGWSQSCLDLCGAKGMLSLSRSQNPLTVKELAGVEDRMRSLVSAAHFGLSRVHVTKRAVRPKAELSPREVEVLQWTADGKSTTDVSRILSISENAVRPHLRILMQKLKVPNTTAAAVRAALLGLLN